MLRADPALFDSPPAGFLERRDIAGGGRGPADDALDWDHGRTERIAQGGHARESALSDRRGVGRPEGMTIKILDGSERLSDETLDTWARLGHTQVVAEVARWAALGSETGSGLTDREEWLLDELGIRGLVEILHPNTETAVNELLFGSRTEILHYRTEYEWIYLGRHLDDVHAWSCGGASSPEGLTERVQSLLETVDYYEGIGEKIHPEVRRWAEMARRVCALQRQGSR